MIQIIINWPDGHESHFKPEFFTKYGPDGTSGDYKGYSAENTQKQLWYGDHVIGQHDFDAIANDKDSLFEYLKGSLFFICFRISVNITHTKITNRPFVYSAVHTSYMILCKCYFQSSPQSLCTIFTILLTL